MSYCTLTIGAGWLKNFDPLVTDPQKGLTAADVAKAMAYADRKINVFFGKRYDISAAAFSTAPMVLEIAELLGSARMVEFKFSRPGDGAGDPGLAATLEAQAEDLMKSVEFSGLLAANGTPIAPIAPAVPRVEHMRD